MSLDGLDQARVAQIRMQLDHAGQPWLTRPLTLQGLAPSSWPLWLWALAGSVTGVWLAARRPGQTFGGWLTHKSRRR